MFKLNFSFWKLKKPKEVNDYTWDKSWNISKNKNLEIQLSRWDIDHVLDFKFNGYWYGRDHAGPSLQIDILGLYFYIGIYDRRHWDYKLGKWIDD